MNASRLLIVRRRHAGNFTQIPNSLIRNEHLSLKALGVIVHLLSLPPGYRISLEGLPPRQNSCRLDKILNSGATMRERRGAIRTGIQG